MRAWDARPETELISIRARAPRTDGSVVLARKAPSHRTQSRSPLAAEEPTNEAQDQRPEGRNHPYRARLFALGSLPQGGEGGLARHNGCSVATRANGLFHADSERSTPDSPPLKPSMSEAGYRRGLPCPERNQATYSPLDGFGPG